MFNADHDLKDMTGIALHLSLCYILAQNKNWITWDKHHPTSFETISYKEYDINDFSWHWSLEGEDYWELHNRDWPPHIMRERARYQDKTLQYKFNCLQSIFIQSMFAD